jgi:hypothetical protein
MLTAAFTLEKCRFAGILPALVFRSKQQAACRQQ